MLGHGSAVLPLDTYADLFPEDLELVSAALDDARSAALKPCANLLRTDCGLRADRPRRLDLGEASGLHQ
jgi:hypothetical protein